MQEIPDVEVTISGEDADAQAARELEEKIEDGEVMMFSGAENTPDSEYRVIPSEYFCNIVQIK